MLSILAEKIHDNRFLRLVRNMLTAGYLEDWDWNATLSGAPQGGVASPILSNIYLHRLDSFVETVLIPEYTRGGLRARNPDYREVRTAIARARRRGDRAAVRALRQQLRSLPSEDPDDPGYRRLRYCRYADDTCSGSPDPRPKPRRSNSAWRRSCVTNSSWNCRQDKTLITHARTGAAQVPRLRDHRPARRPQGHPTAAAAVNGHGRAARAHGR